MSPCRARFTAATQGLVVISLLNAQHTVVSLSYIVYNFLTVIACHDYTILSESYRAVKIYTEPIKCDSLMEVKWYRFSGDAGTKMTDKCPPMHMSCSTSIPGWLNGAHPSVDDGEVERTTCWTYHSGCCSYVKTIKVRNCGEFFVYRLGPAPVCYAVYCGTGTSN